MTIVIYGLLPLFSKGAAMQGADDDDEIYDDADTICVVSIARRVCGEEAVETLIRDFGGTRISFPARPHPDHPLCASLGHREASLIAAECFGVPCYVPMNFGDKAERRRALVCLLAADGKTRAEIARAARCSERMIYRDVAALRARGISFESLRRKARLGRPHSHNRKEN